MHMHSSFHSSSRYGNMLALLARGFWGKQSKPKHSCLKAG